MQINLSNRALYTLLSVMILVLAGTAVYAYNSGGPASYVGHTADELEGVCLSDGTNCLAVTSSIGTLENGKWCTSDGTLVNCQSDEPAAGGSSEIYCGGLFWQATTQIPGETGAFSPDLTALSSRQVAWVDTRGKLRTYTLSGSLQSWQQTGSELLIDSVLNSPKLAALSSTQVALIEGGAAGKVLATYTWSGSSWSQTGSSVNLGVMGSDITALSSTQIALLDSTNHELRTYTWSGSWSQTGSALSVTSNGLIATLSPTQVVVVEGGELTTYTWDGSSSWSRTGSSSGMGGGDSLEGFSPTMVGVYASSIVTLYHWDGSSWSKIEGCQTYIGGTTERMVALSSTQMVTTSDGSDSLRTYGFNINTEKPSSPVF